MNISDIVNSIYFKTGTNVSTYAAADMLIAINNAYERVTSLILQADGRWQWDDTNNTDFPIATTDLVSAQQDYSFASTHLKLIGVSIKNQSGIWRKLLPFDADGDLNSSSTPVSFVPLVNFGPTMDRAEFLKSPGPPQFYDLLGNSVFLYPPPDNGISVTLTAGLKLYFQRGPALFTSAEVTTGTKNPGFNSLYHDLIPLWVAYNYALDNEIPTATGYFNQIQRKEAQLVADYSKRDKDERAIMSPRKIKYI